MTRVTQTGGAPAVRPPRNWRWTALTILLAGGLMLAPAATWALPAPAPIAQGETIAPATWHDFEVLARGTARLPKEQVAWVVESDALPDRDETRAGKFPIGFLLAGDDPVEVVAGAGDASGVLVDGEAAFLPDGEGTLRSGGDAPASPWRILLVSGEDAASERREGSVAGQSFATPEGRELEIELAGVTLSPADEATIPVSPSGTPILFLLTEGTAELIPPTGEPVTLMAGQFALLLDEIDVRGAGDAPATFVFAAIGDEADAESAKAPKVKKDKGARAASAGGGGGSGGQGQSQRVRTPRQPRAGGGGGGGGGGQSQPGTGGAPGGGAGAETPVAGGTPIPDESLPQETPPGTPAPPVEAPEEIEGTPPADDEPDVVQEPSGEEADEDSEVIQEPSGDGGGDNDGDGDGEGDEVDQDPAADDPEVIQEPSGDDPVGDVPEETPGEETDPVEQTPADSTGEEALPPVEDSAAGQDGVVDGPGVESSAAAETIPPAAVLPIDPVPVDPAPIETAPSAPVDEPAAVDPAAGG